MMKYKVWDRSEGSRARLTLQSEAVLEAGRAGGFLGSSGDSEEAERHLLHDMGLYVPRIST